MTRREPSTRAAPPADLLAAARFAADRHRTRRRKDAEASPCVNHTIEVAETLARVGRVRDRDVLLAAILHDTIEVRESSTACCGARGGASGVRPLRPRLA